MANSLPAHEGEKKVASILMGIDEPDKYKVVEATMAKWTDHPSLHCVSHWFDGKCWRFLVMFAANTCSSMNGYRT
jgi:hypothetical protein